MKQTMLMGRATVRAVGVATAVLLAPSVGPVGSPLLPTGAVWAATRSAAPLGAAEAVSAAVKITAVAGGLYHGLALSASGAVFAWGWNIVGQLCNGNTNGSAVPVQMSLPGGTKVIGIAAGFAHSLAVTASGAVLACGKNYDGELGDGTTTDSAVPAPVKLPVGTRATAIAASEVHSLAVTSTGAVLAWGGNNFGQFGDGSYAWSAVPVKVTMRGFAVEPTATTRLAQLAPAMTALATTTRSTTMAGYNFANYIVVPGAVSAIIVVPRLNCTATPAAGSAMYAGVGIQSVNSYARLYLACTPHGVARYYPSLVVNGSIKNMTRDVARAGDTIEVAVSQSASQVTDAVIDLTHPFIASSNGAGSGASEGITVGDYPVVSGATTSGVPNFGALPFFSALINGYPFGSASPSLQTDDLGASSTGPLEIKTTYSVGNKEAFATVFAHS